MRPVFAMLRRPAVQVAAFACVLAVAASAGDARADTGPVIVIPSRPGIPVVINGLDASYAIVEGDWGLARPGHGQVTVYGGRSLRPSTVYRDRNSYHPRYGRPPPRGRHEIEPPEDRRLPEPAESFSRSWSTSSDIVPASQPSSDAAPAYNRAPQAGDQPGSDMVPATIADPPSINPPIIVVPRDRRRP
jgi:hypothetical protein